MRSKLFWAFVGSVLIIIMFSAIPAVQAKNADFYWSAHNYGRGVGTIPPGSCSSDEVEDGGLCYKACRDGYQGVGPVCWEKKSERPSYGRGAGTIPTIKWRDGKFVSHCHSGKVLDAGLCYERCQSGYHGVGPLCHNNNSPSYARGVGRAMHFNCPAGQVNDAGLCYSACRSGYHGVGPVCWGDAPPGYQVCGMGFARKSHGDETCAIAIGSQVIAAGFLGLDAYNAWEASAAAKEIKWAASVKKGTEEAIINGIKLAVDDVSAAKVELEYAVKQAADKGALEPLKVAITKLANKPNVIKAVENFKKMKLAAPPLLASAKGYKYAKGYEPTTPTDYVREVTGWMSIIPGSVAFKMGIIKSEGQMQAWDVLSDLCGAVSAYAWDTSELAN